MVQSSGRLKQFRPLPTLDPDAAWEARVLFRQPRPTRGTRMIRTLLALCPIFMFVAATRAETPKKPATDTYHGVTVTDDYRWMEKLTDPAVKEWAKTQNKTARAALDKVPMRKQLRDRLQALITAPSTDYSSLKAAGGQLFVLKSEPPNEQPFLVVMPSVHEASKSRIVVDPNQIDKN